MPLWRAEEAGAPGAAADGGHELHAGTGEHLLGADAEHDTAVPPPQQLLAGIPIALAIGALVVWAISLLL